MTSASNSHTTIGGGGFTYNCGYTSSANRTSANSYAWTVSYEAFRSGFKTMNPAIENTCRELWHVSTYLSGTVKEEYLADLASKIASVEQSISKLGSGLDAKELNKYCQQLISGSQRFVEKTAAYQSQKEVFDARFQAAKMTIQNSGREISFAPLTMSQLSLPSFESLVQATAGPALSAAALSIAARSVADSAERDRAAHTAHFRAANAALLMVQGLEHDRADNNKKFYFPSQDAIVAHLAKHPSLKNNPYLTTSMTSSTIEKITTTIAGVFANQDKVSVGVRIGVSQSLEDANKELKLNLPLTTLVAMENSLVTALKDCAIEQPQRAAAPSAAAAPAARENNATNSPAELFEKSFGNPFENPAALFLAAARPAAAAPAARENSTHSLPAAALVQNPFSVAAPLPAAASSAAAAPADNRFDEERLYRQTLPAVADVPKAFGDMVSRDWES